MVDASAPARLSFGWTLWAAGVAGLTVVMFPVALMVPAVCLAIGLGFGWWARHRRLRHSLATAATLVGCALVGGFAISDQLSGVNRTGELLGNAVFAAGAVLLAWAVSALARRVGPVAAGAVAAVAGFALLQTACYVLVKVATPGILVSPWLWYVGSMLPYGGWQSNVLMPPGHGYLPSNDWFRLADSLIFFPGEWTFLLAFLLVAVIPRARTTGA